MAADAYAVPPQSAAFDRWVGFCDVLGFRRRVFHDQIEEIRDEYVALIRASRRASHEQVGVEQIDPDTFSVVPEPPELAVFSDSILVWSRPLGTDRGQRSGGDEFSALATGYGFLRAIAMMIQVSIVATMPLRVGIAYGPCIIDRQQNLYIGRPIVDAIDSEKVQEWIGASCHSSCGSAPGFASLGKGLLIQHRVPTKNGYSLEWTVDWPQRTDPNVEMVLRTEAERLGGEPKIKWANALEFFEERQKRSAV